MTDYLEEHLGNAEALLEQIRRLEQSASGLPDENISEKNVDNSEDFVEKARKTEEISDKVSIVENKVYNIETEVNQLRKSVDNMDNDLEIREKERDISVDRRKKMVDNSQNPEQDAPASRPEEAGARTNAERAENRSPLSDQLEELDRAASALTALIPERQGTGGYPVSLPTPRGLTVDPGITGAPGETGIAPGTPAGADFAYGGTPSWAEQADRMFRRDSRRYDGGFYLY